MLIFRSDLQILCKTVLCFVMCCYCITHSYCQSIRDYHPLIRAYPAHILRVSDDTVYWKNGATMPLGTSHKATLTPTLTTAELEEWLNNATLRDQIEQPYAALDTILPPKPNDDAGRCRFEPFFEMMYGTSEETVRTNLVPVQWLRGTPDSTRLLFSRVNGAADALQRVSDALARLGAEYRPFLAKPAGTFKWRTIARTNRRSTHSYGIAIDIHLAATDYWQWNHSPEAALRREAIPFKNRIPLAIVRIFEKHGFIWGGRWYHYDTMHFEFRPELVGSE
ncbi:MAG: M15 family metallopeptidase [Candidatus Kapabacteria bacterium]|nr:M15 family metallopeptidase [Candidatus Kapabacteria bacterium]